MEASFATGLADRYETPFYAYDLAKVEERTRELRAALPEGAKLYHSFYSFKANPLPAIAEQIRSGGGRAEITSQGELTAARRAGYDLSQTLYGGPGKNPAEIGSAIQAGVRWFSCESWRDLQRLSQAGSQAAPSRVPR